MYGRQVLTSGTTWNAANGTIYYIDIQQDNTIICDITTPWGELSSFETFVPGECKLYRQTLSSPYKEHVYIVKLISSNYGSENADIQVLSYAYDSNLLKDQGTQTNQLSISNNLPISAKPGETVNYNFRISNQSSGTVTLKYILATNTDIAPLIITYSPTNCSIPLPPITYTSKKCWYDDWISPPQDCQPKNIGTGVYYDVTGSITMPSTGVEEFMMGVFVEVPNYWGAGKTEWVVPSGFQSGYSISVLSDVCAGISCADPICVYNPGTLTYDLYSQKCVAGICVPDTLLVPNSILCSATHYIDVNIRPYSWYTPGNAADYLITKIVDIDGAISNALLGIIGVGWQYLGVTIIEETDRVILRIYLRDTTLSLSGLSHSGVVSMAAPVVVLLEKIAIIAAVALVIIIAVGIIYSIYLFMTTLQKVFEKNYTPTEVNQMIWGGGEFEEGVVDKQLRECDTNFSQDPLGLKNCYKSVICGAADGTVDALELPRSGDCDSQEINTTIDNCYTQYQADSDYDKFVACMTDVKQTTGNKLQEEANKKTQAGGGMTGLLLLAGLGLVGMTMLGKAPSPSITIREEKR